MRLMRTLMLAAATAAALAGTAAADTPFRSEQYGFSLNAPTGWTAEPDAADAVIRVRVRNAANPQVFCSISTVEHASLKDVAQADLDAQLTQPAGEALIRRDVGAVAGATITTLTVKIIQKNGHPAISSDMVLAANGSSYRIRRMDLFRAGRQYIVNCGGPAEAAQPFSPQFESLHASFRLN